MWTVAFDQLLKQKCKIYRSFFNPPAPLNNVVIMASTLFGGSGDAIYM